MKQIEKLKRKLIEAKDEADRKAKIEAEKKAKDEFLQKQG